MSINRDMKQMNLQKKNTARSPSGAPTVSWVDAGMIRVAVYKNNDMITAASVRYKDSTHTGLTHCRQIAAGTYRLVDGECLYEITSCNTQPRLTNLLLKEVNTDA